MEPLNMILTNSPTFLFVLMRTGAILFTAPIFGAMNVPAQVKVGVTFLLATLLTPMTPFVPLPDGFTSLVLNLGGEILIGSLIGFTMKFIFSGIEFAGQLASFQMGIGMASVYDPIQGAQTTVLGKLLGIVTLLVFLTVNGHLMVIMTLKKSFEVIPPYGFHLTSRLSESFVLLSRDIFILAVKFSAPVVAILIFVNIAMGIMARAVPQLNMFAVGFAVTIFIGFLMIIFSLPVFETGVREAFDRMWENVYGLMRVM